MKKLIIMLVAVAAMSAVKAASVDWKVTAAASDVGKTVYLLNSVGAYADEAALAAAALDSAAIASQGRGAYNTGTVTTTADAITTTSAASFYYAMVNSEGTGFNYVSANMSSYVYDAGNQETSPGAFSSLNVSAISSGTSGAFAPVPEPTSGLLMLLGLAGLALKRKRA